MKAKLVYILSDKYGYGKTAFYEYRGHEYMIHFCNNGCMDDMNVKNEHKHQQAMIDAMIDNHNLKEETKEQKYEDSAQAGFDMFWEYVNQD